MLQIGLEDLESQLPLQEVFEDLQFLQLLVRVLDLAYLHEERFHFL